MSTLGAIATEKVEKTGPKGKGKFIYVDISSVDNQAKRIVEPKTISVDKAPSRAKQNLQTGDVIVSMTRPNLNAVALVPKEFDGAIGSTGFHVLRTKDAEPSWIFYAVQTNDFIEAMCRVVQGALYPAVRPKDIQSYSLAVPPLAEQRRIVAEIEKQFSRLDAGVAALKRAQANLKRYRAGVLKAACEGRLVPTEAELVRAQNCDYESAKELLERILQERRTKWNGRGKYSEPAPPSTSDLPSLPESWTVASLEQLTSPNRVICYGILMPKEHVPHGVPYVKVWDMKGDTIDFALLPRTSHEIAAQYARSSLKGGDILLSIRGTYGRVAEVPPELEGGNITQDTARLAVAASIDRNYIAWFLRSEDTQNYFKRVARGVAVKGVNIGDVRPCPVFLPPLAEQERIVAEVERRLSVVDELEATVTANLQRAARLRQAILQKAFDGKLVAAERPQLTLVDAQPIKKKRSNRHFKRAVLSGEIVHQLHNEPTFGRVKHQKILHLCEYIAKLEEIEGDYLRNVAGPFDNRLIHANVTELNKQQWYNQTKKNGRNIYTPLAKAGAHRPYLERYWPDKVAEIESLINLMRTWDTENCEIFSTAYAAWNDLIIWGKDATEEAILHEILDRWDKSKTRIPEKKWRKAISWMARRGYTPTGFGKATAEPE